MLCELALVATIFLPAADPLPPRPDLSFQVIVHRSITVSSITRAELSALFMRRTRSWPDGREARPVEPSARSGLRQEFSRAIHGKSLAYVTRYWHRVIFAGRGVPPEELPSDTAVIDFVRTHPGAVGYIGRATPPGDAVRVLAVRP